MNNVMSFMIIHKCEVIYEGPANKKHDNTTNNSETLYSLTTKYIPFLLSEKKQEKPFVVTF